MFDKEFFSLVKGICGGFFLLLFTYRPSSGKWSAKELQAFSYRVGAGLVLAVFGTEGVQYLYEGAPTSATAGVLMAFGLELTRKHFGPSTKESEEKNG
jgi:hypothetical protein